MSTEEIFNFIQIDTKIATAGQPTKDQFAAACADGYQAVINLVPNTQDNALKGEDEVVHALGMEYHYIPVIWTDPRPEDFAAFSQLMKSMGDKKVLIHCAANMRVTAFFSIYAMKNLGWSRKQADALMARIWDRDPRFKMPETWRSFIETIRR